MVLCISDWKMATSFITLILTLFHYSLPPLSCKVLHSSIIVTLSLSPGVFHSVRDVGGRRDSWGHNGTSSVAEWSQSPGCHRITCWGDLQSPQRWQHPSCLCCCFPVTCKGTAPPVRPFPIRFFHPPSCSLVAGTLQCRCCYPSSPNPCNQLFPLHLPLRAVCQDVLKLGNKQQWFTGLNLPCFLLRCGKMVLKSFFKIPILIFSFPFQVCQVYLSANTNCNQS